MPPPYKLHKPHMQPCPVAPTKKKGATAEKLDTNLELVTHARALNQRLDSKRAVPKLRAVGAIHLHAVAAHPEVVVNAVKMVRKLGTALALLKEDAERVDHLVDRPNVDVVRKLVLLLRPDQVELLQRPACNAPPHPHRQIVASHYTDAADTSRAQPHSLCL
jgi:hypothetical protein